MACCRISAKRAAVVYAPAAPGSGVQPAHLGGHAALVQLDSRPIVEAFATAVQQKGAFPYDGHVTDTRIAIQAIMP